MAKRREGKVEDYFKAQVAAAGGITRKAKWLCRRGCPDQFWAVRGGASGFAEIKAEGGVLDPHQAREIAKLRAAGLRVDVLSTFEEVDAFVKWNVR